MLTATPAIVVPDSLVVEWADTLIDGRYSPTEALDMADMADSVGLDVDASAIREAVLLILYVVNGL